MNLKTFWIALAGWVLMANADLHAQGSETYGKGIRVNLDESGQKHIRFITWHQIWLRFNENNSGSTRLGEAQNSTTDFGIRRSRFLAIVQLNPRFLILTHFGINNQNAVSGGYLGTDGKRPQLYVHDAWTEYRVVKNYLHIGMGLHYWNGISRMSSASTLNFMNLDAPIFNWATIEATDQFARMLGVYAKGQIGKLDYRLAINDPFLTNTAGVIDSARAQYSPRNNKKVYQGYAFWQFWDKESNYLPFTVGSYLGTKKVFNLGAGFLQNSDAMWSKTATGDTAYHNQLLLGFDAFLDMPLNKEKGTALTVYGVYYNYDFGPNQVRNIGILNPATGGGSLRGNAFPLLGTGSIVYAQAGYLFPKSWLGNKGRLQTYLAYSHANFEGVKDASGKVVPVQVLDIGGNYFLDGHHAKITLNYRSRPDFTNVNALRYRPEITLQTMIYL